MLVLVVLAKAVGIGGGFEVALGAVGIGDGGGFAPVAIVVFKRADLAGGGVVEV